VFWLILSRLVTSLISKISMFHKMLARPGHSVPSVAWSYRAAGAKGKIFCRNFVPILKRFRIGGVAAIIGQVPATVERWRLRNRRTLFARIKRFSNVLSRHPSLPMSQKSSPFSARSSQYGRSRSAW
jgi:hypothetical protein